MSDDESGEESDPFDRLGPDEDREGDPFERLDDAPDQGHSSEQDTDRGEDDLWVPPGEDRRDGPRGGARDGVREGPWDDVRDHPDDTNPTDGITPRDSASSPENVDPPDPAVTPDDPAGQSLGPDDDPFENVDTPTESPFDGDGDSVFERVDSGNVDPDDVWEAITAEDGEEPAEPSVPDEGRYTDVSKHRFCEQCEHFSEPPDVSCGHHTAEIIEFLDMDTVRLLDCPVVAERKELEQRD